MKKSVILFLSFVCLIFFAGCTKEDPYSYVSRVKKISGDYRLADIQLLGHCGEFDLDGIYSNSENILSEFKNKAGYYEPDYTATVGEELVLLQSSENEEERAVAFNVTIPYPYYIIEDGNWKCTGIHALKQTIQIPGDEFLYSRSFYEIFPEFNDPDDVFLSNVQWITVYYNVEREDFTVGLFCRLPEMTPDLKEVIIGLQDKLSYKFSR